MDKMIVDDVYFSTPPSLPIPTQPFLVLLPKYVQKIVLHSNYKSWWFHDKIRNSSRLQLNTILKNPRIIQLHKQ